VIELLTWLVCCSLWSDATAAAQPEIFAPGVISTGDPESHPAFTPDGNTVYFIKTSPAFTMWTILESHREETGWSEPRVSTFSGRYMDADPFITRDGKRLWFISNRPATAGGSVREDHDLWYMDRTPTGWGDPRRAPEPLNSEKSEYHPTITDNGVIYFGSERAGGHGGADVYRCRLVDATCQAPPENLGPVINSPEDDYEPLIAPNGTWLVYMTDRKGGLGGHDLWASRAEGGRWTTPENLGAPINSDTAEYGPRLSADRTRFFFSSRRAPGVSGPLDRALTYEELLAKYRGPGNGMLDIYSVDIRALEPKLHGSIDTAQR
jgi:Tol biopolymer transport system component